MNTQFISFTALPSGARDDRLRLTLFISPNLTAGSDASLSAFPAFLRWPEVVSRLTFQARFRTVDRRDLGTVTLTPTAAPADDVEAWLKVFPPSLAVGACAADTCQAPAPPEPATYDVVGVRDALRELYAGEVADGIEPSKDEVRARRRAALFAAIRRYEANDLKMGSASPSIAMKTSSDRVAAAFRALQAFHVAPDMDGLKADTADGSDFHELVGAAGQYPFLLRLFGLAIDFEVSADAAPLGDHQLAIVPGGDALLFGKVATTVVTPWTTYRHSVAAGGARTFASLGRDGSAHGFLPLKDPKYEVAVEDIDGGGYGALDFVERQVAALASPAPGSVQDALPALRTKGVQVFNTRASAEILAAQQRAAEIADLARTAAAPFPPPSGAVAVAPVLFREDIVRGYRVDVRAESAPWRSLCERHSHTGLTPSPIHVREEGFVSESLTDANAAATGSDTRSSQVVFRWNGWSLVAPRPGAASAEDGSPTREGGQSAAFSMRDRVPPGSLPKLRFGQEYQLRCREVDLAGNGPAAADPTTPAEAAVSVRYVRHDPVLPPRFARAEPEGTAHLIISAQGPGLPRTAKIALLPPIASVDQADKHGAFDNMTPEASYRTLARTGVETVDGAAAQLIDPAFGGVIATRAWPLGDATVHVTRIEPELLDVDAEPLEVRAAPGAYDLDASGGSVRIKVPPAGAMKVKIASLIPERIRSSFETHGAQPELGSRVYHLIAPPSEVIVIHPVERPLARPDFGTTADPAIPPVRVAPRALGDSHATFLADEFSVHAESTGRFDVFGEWDEVMDAPEGDLWPSRIRQRVRLFGGEAPLPDGHPLAAQAALQRMRQAPPKSKQGKASLLPPENARYDFRDTKHRKVELTAIGVSRFEDAFAKTPNDDADRFLATSVPTTTSVPNTRPPAPPRVAYIVPTLARSGTKRGRKVREQVTEGWGLRVYLTPGDWFESGDGVRLAALFSQPPAQGQLSQIAGDPMVAAAAVVNDLTSSDFIGARSEHANCKQVIGRSGAAGQALADAGLTYDFVSASTFDVGWDADKGLIYADLVLRRRHAYRPFVRLALARFQPESVEGAHLSTTVLADFLQLSPERTLSITRLEKGVHLRLTGAFPAASGPGRVRTRLMAIAETGGGGGDPLWEETGRQEFTRQHQTEDLEAAAWTATLPRSMFDGSRRRIVIEEWEVWPQSLSGQTSGRLVYSEAVEL